MNCRACGAEHGDPVYLSGTPTSVTSICTLLSTAIEVYLCSRCGVLQTFHCPALSLDSFWSEYHAVQSLANEVPSRSEAEAAWIQTQLTASHCARVLVVGGVRSQSIRLLAQRRPDLQIYAWLETQDYLARFDFLAQDRIQVGETPSDFGGGFDIAIRLYDLVHQPKTIESLDRVGATLKKGGKLLVATPDLLTNPGDLVVSNHLVHFCAHSLKNLLERNGWSKAQVDDKVFQGRVFAVATRDGSVRRKTPKSVDTKTCEKIEALCQYWTKFGDRVKTFESEQGALGPAAIYGAGFYGAFILSQLRNPSGIQSFLDGNEDLEGKTIASIPIQCARSVPKQRVLYVGLNPTTAKVFDEAKEREGLPTFLP